MTIFAHLTAIFGAAIILSACEKPTEPVKPKTVTSTIELPCDVACRVRVSTSGNGDFPEIDTSFPPDPEPKHNRGKQ